jgi:hypothetical protein
MDDGLAKPPHQLQGIGSRVTSDLSLDVAPNLLSLHTCKCYHWPDPGRAEPKKESAVTCPARTHT